jgi:hypothetical protein
MASTTTPLSALASLLRDGENVISPYVRDTDEEPALGTLAASGPRATEAPGEYMLLVEAIREGYLLHYGTPRLIDGADGDLRLLAGDYLYALGLERLAGRGDLDAVRELADLISLAAQVHAENGDGWGSTERVAPRSARSPLASIAADATDLLRRSAAETARRAGMSDALALAADSIGFAAEDVPNIG